jgi:hypothetical protein
VTDDVPSRPFREGPDWGTADDTESGDSQSPAAGAWERTLSEAREIVAEYEEAGWTTELVIAGHVAPEPPDVATTDVPTLGFVVPGESTDAVAAVLGTDVQVAVRVHRREMAAWTFLVIELVASDVNRSVVLAGAYESRLGSAVATPARETGRLATEVRTLDGTVAGRVVHDPTPVFPTG